MKDIINLRLKQVFEFLKVHYKLLLNFSAPLIVIYSILRTAIFNSSSIIELDLSVLIAIGIDFFYFGTLVTIMIYIIDGAKNGKNISADAAIVFYKKKVLLITASVIIIIILTNIGFLLLIVPGILVFTRLAAVPFLISLDNVKLSHAMNLSFEYSKDFVWPMFFCLVIIFFITLNFGFIFGLVGIELDGFIGNVIFSLTYVLDIILIYFFYQDIKVQMVEDYKNTQALNPPTTT